MDLQQKIELHERFWRGEAPRPLLGFFIESPGRPGDGEDTGAGYPNVDIDTPVEQIVEKYRRTDENAGDRPGDRVPSVRVNYGTSFLPALAGAEYENDGHTAWCVPTGLSASELTIPELDRDLPLWRSYERKLRALVEADLRNVVVTFLAMTGPVEMLLDLLGPEQLCFDMHDDADAVLARIDECLRLWRQVFAAHWEILQDPPGTVGFGVWLPGRSCLWSEDSMALAGPRQFDPFFRRSITAVARCLDTPFLHTHSAGAACYEQLSGVEELAGVEISNDPNGPPLQALIDAAVRFQRNGKSVMLSNWKRPLTEDQVDHILDRVDPGRTLITLTVSDREKTEDYMRKVRDRWGAG